MKQLSKSYKIPEEGWHDYLYIQGWKAGQKALVEYMKEEMVGFGDDGRGGEVKAMEVDEWNSLLEELTHD